MASGVCFSAQIIYICASFLKTGAMENTLNPPVPQSGHGGQLSHLVIAALLCLLCYLTYDYVRQTQKDRVNMEKSSGRNGKHSNPKARKSAEEQYRKAKEEFDQLDKKPKKTKEENKLLDKLRKKVEHWRKKKDWGGESHSQKHKGN